jgi:alkylhydroperoxidase/carboxymuconolactone decarboxylase family protein YurZ
MSEPVTQQEVDAAAEALLAAAPEGEELDERIAALARLGLSATVVVLDPDAIREHTARALELGWTAPQIHEILTLVSGMGVHTFFEATRALDELAPPAEPSPEAEELWRRHVGDDPYWDGMEEEVPGFLRALNRRSPEAFEAFFAYNAVPWRTRQVRAIVKELISIGVDAQPAHRYLPGMRLHIRNALTVGAGRRQIRGILAIAAGSGMPPGVR